MKYICKQLQCKQKVPETERPEALDSYPHLRDWLRTINLRPELIEVGSFLFLPPPPLRHSGLGNCVCHVLCGFSLCTLACACGILDPLTIAVSLEWATILDPNLI